MSRFLRILFWLTSAVSLLLGIATVAFWIRSRGASEAILLSKTDVIGATTRDRYRAAVSDAGRVAIFILTREETRQPGTVPRPIPLTDGWRCDFQHSPGGEGPNLDSVERWFFSDERCWRYRWKGFLVTGTSGEENDALRVIAERGHMMLVVVPNWFVLLLTVPLPCWALVRVIRYRRARSQAQQGHCRKCGYDLRATPQRCPECGTVAAPPPIDANDAA